MNTVDRQLIAYLIVCSGTGMVFGAFGGVPGMFPGFFIPKMWMYGTLLVGIGATWFAWEARR